MAGALFALLLFFLSFIVATPRYTFVKNNAMIYHSKVHQLLDAKDKTGECLPVDISFIKGSTGEIIQAYGVVKISQKPENGTYNFRWPNGQIRTIKKLAIIKINGHEVKFG